MPYVHLNVSCPLSPEQIEETREAIAERMPLLPGKNRENTMIHITGGCAIFKGESDENCAFLEIRVYQPSPMESKQAFVKEVGGKLCDLLGVPPKRMYVNILEMENWGSGEGFH